MNKTEWQRIIDLENSLLTLRAQYNRTRRKITKYRRRINLLQDNIEMALSCNYTDNGLCPTCKRNLRNLIGDPNEKKI